MLDGYNFLTQDQNNDSSSNYNNNHNHRALITITMLKLLPFTRNNKGWGNTTNWKNTLFRKAIKQ